MLAISLVEEIDRLLQEGELSQRKIAARLDVSRGTVGAIASGRRGIFGREPETGNDHPLMPLKPPERCPRCGFLVYMPCLVCGARAYRQRQREEQLQAIHRKPKRRPAARASRRRSLPANNRSRHARVA